MDSVKLDHLADAIKESGVRTAFGILGGGRSLELVSALRDRGISFYSSHFEGTAAMMAGVTGLLTGKVGVAVSIKGPGLANMVPGLALCKFENLPMVALSEAFEKNPPLTRTHKFLDHHSLVSAVTKYADKSKSSSLEDRFNLGRDLATKEIPGPVHLDLISEPLQKPPIPEESSKLTAVEDVSDCRLKKLLKSAKKPVLIVGSLCIRLKLQNYIEDLSLPILTTVAAKGVVNEEYPYSAGIFTGAGLEDAPERSILRQADLVLGIGVRLNEILDQSADIQDIVNFDIATKPTEMNGNVKTLCVDKGTIISLLEKLKTFEWGGSQIDYARERLLELASVGEVLPWNVYQALQSKLPDNTRYVVDTGNFCTVAEHFLVSRKPYEKIFSANGRYMGSSVPLGIAASLVGARAPTVVVCGDGGIGMYISEIKIAVDNQLPILVIQMSDQGYASILGAAKRRGFSKEVLQIQNPSWQKVLAGFELETMIIETPSELNTALEDFLSGAKPHFIECRFNPQAYLDMTKTLRA